MADFKSTKLQNSTGITINPATEESVSKSSGFLSQILDALAFGNRRTTGNILLTDLSLSNALANVTTVGTVTTVTTVTTLSNISNIGGVNATAVANSLINIESERIRNNLYFN